MKRILAGAAILIPACTPTVVDVGPATGSLTDGGTTGGSTSRWMGNESNCPTSAPAFDPPPLCDVREAQSCVWLLPIPNQEPFYVQCTCYERDRSTKLWYCTNPFRSNDCPATEPASDTDCFGHVGSQCPYPLNRGCDCPSNDPAPRWSCVDTTAGPPGSPTSGPASIPETKRIKDLSASEAQIWCEWFLTKNGTGFPPPFEGPITADGFAINLGFTLNPNFYANVCMPTEVSATYCAANLKLFPCEATVGELSDCVLTVARGVPAVHGCGRFLEAASCSQTIFARPDDSDAGSGGCGALKVR